MNALILAALLAFEGPVTLRLDWEGGDRSTVATAQPEASHDATADSGARMMELPESASQTAICPCLGYRGRAHCYCLQRGVACKCNRTTGSEWIMENGKPVKKTGRYANPNNVVAPSNAAPFSPAAGSSPQPPGADSRPVVTIVSPASFHCPACEALKRLDWSGQPFDVVFVSRDGPRLFPQIEWQGANGRKQILSGYYTPDRVAWSFRRTQ